MKNALTPHVIDSDGRAFHQDSESGPNSKITKNTNMTFLQKTAVLFKNLSKTFASRSMVDLLLTLPKKAGLAWK